MYVVVVVVDDDVDGGIDDAAAFGSELHPHPQREREFLEFALYCCIVRRRIRWRDGIENLVPS